MARPLINICRNGTIGCAGDAERDQDVDQKIRVLGRFPVRIFGRSRSCGLLSFAWLCYYSAGITSTSTNLPTSVFEAYCAQACVRPRAMARRAASAASITLASAGLDEHLTRSLYRSPIAYSVDKGQGSC